MSSQERVGDTVFLSGRAGRIGRTRSAGHPWRTGPEIAAGPAGTLDLGRLAPDAETRARWSLLSLRKGSFYPAAARGRVLAEVENLANAQDRVETSRAAPSP